MTGATDVLNNVMIYERGSGNFSGFAPTTFPTVLIARTAHENPTLRNEWILRDVVQPPVGDRTRRRHRSPAVEHGVHDLGRARDIEDALVLARERRVAGVLADRRRADGHARTRIPDPSAELRVRRRDQLVQLGMR